MVGKELGGGRRRKMGNKQLYDTDKEIRVVGGGWEEDQVATSAACRVQGWEGPLHAKSSMHACTFALAYVTSAERVCVVFFIVPAGHRPVP
jgi:hypothetical protein